MQALCSRDYIFITAGVFFLCELVSVLIQRQTLIVDTISSVEYAVWQSDIITKAVGTCSVAVRHNGGSGDMQCGSQT